MNKHLIIAGGTGFLGKLAARHFTGLGWQVSLLSRNPEKSKTPYRCMHWNLHDKPEALSPLLEGADVLLNLAGKSVDCRYSEANRMAILRSRLESTNYLGKAMMLCENPPKLWINASSATIYRDAQTPQTEAEGELGEGFSVTVCRQWERSFFSFEEALPHTRFAALRLGIVLAENDSAFVPLKRLAQAGVGRLASGQQYISWLHAQDYLNILQFILEHPEVSGCINATSPNPSRNTDFMQTLKKQCLALPWSVSLPKPLLEWGAWLIRTETELILKSRCVVPEKLLKAGFRFQYPEHPLAIKSLLS